MGQAVEGKETQVVEAIKKINNARSDMVNEVNLC